MVKNGGSVIASGVERDGLGADPDAEVDLGAGGGDDRAVADDESAVRLRAGCVRRERHGLRERRNAQRRRQQADEQKVDPRIFRDICALLFAWVSFLTQPGKSAAQHGAFRKRKFMTVSETMAGRVTTCGSLDYRHASVSGLGPRNMRLACFLSSIAERGEFQICRTRAMMVVDCYGIINIP